MPRRMSLLGVLMAVSLSACAGGKTLSPQESCACSDYYGSQTRPAWVDAGDQITAQSYRSNGMANCTGVQPYDGEKAELSARAKLSRMLAVRSDVRISETRKSYGGGPGYAQASIEATQISQTLLNDSKIYGRWVDAENCVVYAAAEISTANIEKQRAELARQQAAKLVNKKFEVSARSGPAELLTGEAKALLSGLGVTRISDAGTHILALSFTTTERQENAIRGRLNVSIETTDGTVIWSHTQKAKGVSFKALSKTELTARAIADGMARLEPALRSALMK